MPLKRSLLSGFHTSTNVGIVQLPFSNGHGHPSFGGYMATTNLLRIGALSLLVTSALLLQRKAMPAKLDDEPKLSHALERLVEELKNRLMASDAKLSAKAAELQAIASLFCECQSKLLQPEIGQSNEKTHDTVQGPPSLPG